MSTALKVTLICLAALLVGLVGPAAMAQDSAAGQQLDQAIAKMVVEADNIDPKEKPTAEPVFTRPHPQLTSVPPSAAPEIIARMSKRHTGNLLKDAYINYHLMYVLLQAPPEELQKLAKQIKGLSNDLPEIPELPGREEYRYDPPEVGAKWHHIYHSVCHRMVGFPPFERHVYPPESFQYMTPRERRELEPLWEEAKKLKFRTLSDNLAVTWNRRVYLIYHYLRLYEGEVLCARLASGDEGVLDDVGSLIGRTIKSKPGIAADYISYLGLAYRNGYLGTHDTEKLKRYARSLAPLVSGTGTGGGGGAGAAGGKWFDYQSHYRNLPEGAFHILHAMGSGRPAPKSMAGVAPRPAPTSPPRSGSVTADTLDLTTITAAIDRASHALLSIRQPDLYLTYQSNTTVGLPIEPPDMRQLGHHMLSTWALLAAGESHQSPWMLRRINWTMQHETPSTYDRAMRLQVLGRLPETEWRNWFVRDVNGLINSMTPEGGFSARLLNDKPGGFGDNPNSQYAIMGLWAAERAQQEIPVEVWRRIDNYWRRSQQPPPKPGEPAGWAVASFASITDEEQMGGFTTKVSGPMTAAGVMALSITERMLNRGKRSEAAVNLSPQLRSGIRWLDANFGLDAIDGDQDFYYYIWTIQNVGQATGFRTFNKIDWFREATARLINTQQPSGLWSGPKGDVVSTSFALLYLYRASGPLAICKVRWMPPTDEKKRGPKPTESWNNHPSDLYNFTEYVTDAFETPTSWQIADLDQPVHELMETPILYLASDKPVTLGEDHMNRLRSYIQAGGTLVCVPEGRGATQVINSMKTLAKGLFPDLEAQKVAPTDSLYTLYQKINPPVPMFQMHNGVRPLMIVIERDIGKDLQAGTDKDREAFNLMANIYLFVTGREPRRARLDQTYLTDRGSTPAKQVAAARITFGGHAELEPGAMSQLATLLANDHHVKLVYDGVSPASLSAQKVAFLSVTPATPIDDATETEALAKWVQAGGTLWIDAVGGGPEAAARVNALVEKLGIAGDAIKPLAPDHPILTGQGLSGGYDNRTAKLRGFTHAPRARADSQIRAATLGSGTVLVSTEDLSSGLAGLNHWGIQGYAPLSARQIVVNSVLEVAKK